MVLSGSIRSASTTGPGPDPLTWGHAGNAPSMPLLRRFQRRVAEGSMSSSDLKLYFVNTKRGAAELNDLNLNEWGEIENWPDGFFGDEMGEIAAISKASLERQIQA